MQLKLIGAAIDQCANIRGAADTPEIINSRLQNSQLTIDQILYYQNSGHNLPTLKTYFTNLANSVYKALDDGFLPITIGGDHSCAIGSWSGVAKYLADNDQSLGLIWIDAHMDAHTPENTISGNIHGMPLAVLLGHGFPEFTNILYSAPKIDPENIILIGIHSYEKSEVEFLTDLGVKIYYSHEVTKHGFAHVFNQAWHTLINKVGQVGLTIDMDGFDPEFTPGVSTAEPGGINFNHFMHVFKQLDISKLLALEIAETNIYNDIRGRTVYCMLEIIETINKLSQTHS